MIPQETKDLILDTARIEDVVSDFVSLKRRGASFVACCPFHNEKTPSFYVTPSKGIFKCFGCGKSGTAVGFVMEHEHCGYVEALHYLARKYHIEIVEKEESAEEVAQRQRRESLLLVSEFAQKFFASQLKSGEGKTVGYSYFRSRGLEDSTIERFGLGWAPSGRTALLDAAAAAGYKQEYLIGAGLAVQREDGSVVDKFRERVMFPIYSVSGRVVAFSGRTLHADNPAKYVNSPDTEIYHKSNNLLGIYHAKAEISRQHKCILVEGNVDMTTMHQLGLTNVVASCGTSLTVEQIRLIARFTAPDNNVTIMYDGDSAGIHAALRGLDMVLAEGLNVKVVLLPDGEDPDSFCRKHSLEEVKEFLERNEKDFIEFKSDLLLSEAAGDPLKKANLINDVADSIARIPDAIKRSVYVETCSARFGIESGAIFERIGKTLRSAQQGRRTDSVRPPEPAAPQTPPVEVAVENRTLAKAEADIIGFLLMHGCDELDFPSDSPYYSGEESQKPTVADFIRSALSADDTSMANSMYRKTYEGYMSCYDAGMAQDAIVRHLLDSGDRQIAAVAADLSIEKYTITVEKFEASLTTTSSWLVYSVPRAILYYVERRIQDQIEGIRRSLDSADPQEQENLMRRMMQLQAAQKNVKKQLGREK